MYCSSVGSAGIQCGGCWIEANSVLSEVENIQVIGMTVKASKSARKTSQDPSRAGIGVASVWSPAAP